MFLHLITFCSCSYCCCFYYACWRHCRDLFYCLICISLRVAGLPTCTNTYVPLFHTLMCLCSCVCVLCIFQMSPSTCTVEHSDCDCGNENNIHFHCIFLFAGNDSNRRSSSSRSWRKRNGRGDSCRWHTPNGPEHSVPVPQCSQQEVPNWQRVANIKYNFFAISHLGGSQQFFDHLILIYGR